MILVCDLVVRNGWKRLYPEDARVVALSELLRLMPIHPESVRGEKFRNPNGVGRKSVDLATRRTGFDGVTTHGSALDGEVVRAFETRPDEMARAAHLIREGVASGAFRGLPEGAVEEAEEYSAPEGRLLLRRHLARERDRTVRRRKIADALGRGGRLACEACDFDFEARYGARGAGYIEVHHVVPLHLTGETRTRLGDLALICANCHRMIHRRAPWLTPAELRASIRRE